MKIEGISVEELSVLFTGIKPGEMYMAKRNAGWKLLTCKKVHPDGYILPEERAYPYNLNECFRVTE